MKRADDILNKTGQAMNPTSQSKARVGCVYFEGAPKKDERNAV
jgi:hypothetical protein